MNKNRTRFVINIVVIVILVGIVVFQFYISNDPEYPYTYSGLAVDSSGRLYIAEGRGINVYEDGVRVDRIMEDVIARGFYEYTIIDDKIHLWHNNMYFRILTLDGEVEESHEIEDPPMIWSRPSVFEYQAADGSHYVMEDARFLGRLKVVRYYPDGREEIVFQIPLIQYIDKLLTPVEVAALLWLGIQRQIRRKEKIPAFTIQNLKQYWRPEKKDK